MQVRCYHTEIGLFIGDTHLEDEEAFDTKNGENIAIENPMRVMEFVQGNQAKQVMTPPIGNPKYLLFEEGKVILEYIPDKAFIKLYESVVEQQKAKDAGLILPDSGIKPGNVVSLEGHNAKNHP